MATAERRPKLVIGPGFVLALVLAGLLLWRNQGQTWWRQPARPTVGQATPAPGPPAGLTPEPGWLLRRGDEIGLTAAQRTTLETIVADWERTTAEDRQRLEAQARAVSGQLDQGRPAGPAVADYSALSAALAARRQAAWDDALAVLTAAQEARVGLLRREAPTEWR